MATMIVLEIERKLLTSNTENKIKEISKFYEKFTNNAIAILFEKNMTDVELYNIIGDKMVQIEMYQLNNFARNRLINNFEDDRPELTLTLMGAALDSKLIKVWEKNVKRQ